MEIMMLLPFIILLAVAAYAAGYAHGKVVEFERLQKQKSPPEGPRGFADDG